LYRPIVRIDVAVEGPTGDSFAVWSGSQWDTQTNEGWWSQGEPYTGEGYKWRVTDEGGAGYYMEPGQGQFDDGGEGDNAFIYAVQHHSNEGDNDLGVIGDCCLDDYQQGPHIYLNNEGIANQDIVIWYVPQMMTDASAPDYYCWTVAGEPNPETYPCFGGPMFVPIEEEGVAPTAGFSHNPVAAVGEVVAFTNTTTGDEPITYTWDFGDGVGVSNETSPTYQYTDTGTYTVTLTAENAFGSQSVSSTITVGDAYAIIEPEVAAALVYTDTAGHLTTIEVPAGAVSGTTTIVYTGLEDAPPPPKFHLFANMAFNLEAYQDGVLVPDFVFNTPVVMTLNYHDEDVTGIVEETLALYYWEGGVWVDASTTCEPPSTYERNTAENWLSVGVCHLTDFGLFGESVIPLNYFYLPALARN
jgi:PKD repeat protein